MSRCKKCHSHLGSLSPCARHCEKNVAMLESAALEAATMISPPNMFLGNAHEVLSAAVAASKQVRNVEAPPNTFVLDASSMVVPPYYVLITVRDPDDPYFSISRSFSQTEVDRLISLLQAAKKT